MGQDAFDILGLEPRFDLSSAAIQAAYLRRVASLHPDREGDEDLAAGVNAARQALQDPEQRANALMTRLGGPGASEDRSLPEGFLPAVMALREELDTARSAGDEASVAKGLAWAAAERDRHIASAGSLFAKAAAAAGPEQGALLRALRRELNAWRYIERLLEQIGRGEGGL